VVCWRFPPNLEIVVLTGPGPVATDGPIEWADVSANRRNIYSTPCVELIAWVAFAV
jgi:hypothetical protein